MWHLLSDFSLGKTLLSLSKIIFLLLMVDCISLFALVARKHAVKTKALLTTSMGHLKYLFVVSHPCGNRLPSCISIFSLFYFAIIFYCIHLS